MSDNPERDWTEQEKEEFFASQDALTGILNGVPNQPPIEWSTGWWNGAIHPLSSEDPFGDLEHFIHPGIHVTSIVPPEQGWPIAAHCTYCRNTVIALSPYAKKPEDGDYYMLKGTCLDEEMNVQHNLYPQFDYPWQNRMGPRPEEWTEKAFKHYWNPLGVPEEEKDNGS